MNELLQLIRDTRGRFFRVIFTKRTNGERREMVARLGVKKNIIGTGLRFNPRRRNLMVVYDVIQDGYRMIPLDSTHSFKCGSKKWRAA